MIDQNLAQQLLQSLHMSNNLSAIARQMELNRFWADELAKPRYADPKRLSRYGFKVYSQCDEDGILQEIFSRIGTTNRDFVEFGVQNGVECNTAKLLIEGWRGLWLEGVGPAAAEIRRSFESFLKSGHLKVKDAIVTAENIDALLQEHGVGGEIDLLSIDIDFNDYWVWKAITAVKPRVVVIEYNATLRPPMSFTVPYDPMRQWDGTNYAGASLEALVRLGREKGYRLVGCSFSGANAFFVRQDIGRDRFLEPATAEEHYEPPRYFFAALLAGHRARPGPYIPV